MKVYLGGKITGHVEGGDWRNSIVDGGKDDGDFGAEYTGQVEGINLYASCGDGSPPDRWPILKNAITYGKTKHDYVGPFLVGCDHGCFHSGDHATSIAWNRYSHDGDDGLIDDQRKQRTQIVKLCTDAMASADLLFFWLDSLDAYGTLAELVWAVTAYGSYRAQMALAGKPVRDVHFVVASPSFKAIDEMWFGLELVKHWGDVKFIAEDTVWNAFVAAMIAIEHEQAEAAIEYSPIEKMFIDEWRTVYGNGIVSQFNVPGFRYRVDFAFPADKVAVELDGYEYHSSKEQFTNDRQRQREMEIAGWRFIRFSGSEVFKSVGACVQQAHAFWQSVSGKSVVYLNGEAMGGAA